MSQFPYMPLFIDAYLADTTHFSAEEHGAYLLLLMAMWRRGGSVPNDDKDLARFCRVHRCRWPRVKARLMPLLTEKDGELTQKKLCKVFNDVVEYQRKNGKGRSLKSLDLPPLADAQKRVLARGVGSKKNKDLRGPKSNSKYSTLPSLSAPFIRDDNGSAAIGPSPAVEGRSGPTPIPGARRPDKPWPPPSQLIQRVYPNGRAAAKHGDNTALDPLPGAPEKPKKETRQ